MAPRAKHDSRVGARGGEKKIGGTVSLTRTQSGRIKAGDGVRGPKVFGTSPVTGLLQYYSSLIPVLLLYSYRP